MSRGFLWHLWLGFHYGIINIAAVKTRKKWWETVKGHLWDMAYDFVSQSFATVVFIVSQFQLLWNFYFLSPPNEYHQEFLELPAVSGLWWHSPRQNKEENKQTNKQTPPPITNTVKKWEIALWFSFNSTVAYCNNCRTIFYKMLHMASFVIVRLSSHHQTRLTAAP